MEQEKQFKYSSLGDSYWWLAGKYKVVTRFLKALSAEGGRHNRQGSLRVLDIGCGPGNFLNELSGFGAVTGTDASFDALRICSQRGRANRGLINSKADTLPIRSNTFDMVVLLDVLEHVADDKKVLGEVHRILGPKGMVLITVPAYKLLWGDHDDMYGHYRRYRPAEIKKMVTEAGFTVKALTAFEAVFLAPLLLFRRLKQAAGGDKHDDFISVPGFLNTFLTKVILLEGAVARAINHPIGVSIICTATKR